MIEYAELCAKTNFSFLQGASHPEEMVTRAKELGLSAIAIADRHGVYGSVRAHAAASKLQQPCIVGAEVEVIARPDRSCRSNTTSAKRQKEQPLLARATLLVQNEPGYYNLCRILTRAHADLPRETAFLEPAALAAHADGLVLLLEVPLASCAGGPSWQSSGFGNLVDAYHTRVFLATSRRLALDDEVREQTCVRASAQWGVPLIATNRPMFHHPDRKPLADVLACIRHTTTLDKAQGRLAANAEAYLRTPAQMQHLFRDDPARLERTVDIARGCKFSLDQIHYSFPSDDLCPGETADAALARLVEEGARQRYPRGVPTQVRSQLDSELALIERLKVAQFFLSVHDVVNIARGKRILCQGRGSAANSAVCFVLGITAVDPARSSLLFERFLSAERGEPPDIDVDFEHERREEVIQAIYAKYGRDRAAMVSEVITFRGRSALRETSKVFGLSLEQADQLTKTIGPYDRVSAEQIEQRIVDAGFDPQDRRVQLVLQLASQVQGFPRHMSTHVGGFVLSARPICEVAPVEPAKIPGRTVIPWDKDDIDALGFFKVDVLGLGMLTAIRKALALVVSEGRKAEFASESTSPPPPPPSPLSPSPSLPLSPFDPIAALAEVPSEDASVYDAICKADTVGIFQIESRAQMAMLPRMRPRRFYDLVIEVAIVRPGPIHGGMVHPYLRRRNREEAPTMPHPSLTPILERTLGIPLFQEQVMQIAMVGAGYTAGDADQLRRDMAAWRRNGRLLRHRDKLLQGFAQRGIASEFGERLFEQIQGFGEYGFPESHAASFALLVYASAWLKVHHPAAFACALLNSQPMGFYAPATIVRDAQQHGVRVLPPDVSFSTWDSTLEPCPAQARGPSDATRETRGATRGVVARAARKGSVALDDRHGGEGGVVARAAQNGRALRLGLRLVKGMGEDAANRIAAARSDGPFRDVKDFGVRAKLRLDQIEILAEAGALASLVRERRQAIWKARAPDVGHLFDGIADNEPAVSLAPLPSLEALRCDYTKLGLSVSDHPMRYLQRELEKRGAVKSSQLAEMRHGSKVCVAGLVLSRQRPATASGIVFVTLEDEIGLINLILRANVFDQFRATVLRAKILLVHGTLERTPRAPLFERLEASQGGPITPVIHVMVQRLEELTLPASPQGSAALAARSRDFH